MDAAVLAALERVAIGSVAVTARAIAESAADLTFLQWRALVVIGAEPEGVSVGELAVRVGLHQSPASRLVGRLVARGLVTSTAVASDRRQRRIALTHAGGSLRASILASRSGELRRIAAGWPAQPEGRAFLVRLAAAFDGAR